MSLMKFQLLCVMHSLNIFISQSKIDYIVEGKTNICGIKQQSFILQLTIYPQWLAGVIQRPRLWSFYDFEHCSCYTRGKESPGGSHTGN